MQVTHLLADSGVLDVMKGTLPKGGQTMLSENMGTLAS